MRLATKSPFAGERGNALAAARRLAARHGMSLGDANRAAPPPKPEPEAPRETGRPRPHYRPYRRTYDQSGMNDKADALRAYARMRNADRKQQEAKERFSNAIAACVLLIFGAFGAIGILSLYLVKSFDPEQDSSVIDRLLEWAGQLF